MNWSLAQQLLVSGVVAGTFYGLLGVSWNVLYATTRIFHFAHAFVFVAAAYGATVLVSNGVPIWPALLGGVVVGALVGGACEVVLYRSLRRHGSTPLSLFLASMGLTVAGTNTIQLIFGAGNRALDLSWSQHIFHVGQGSFDGLDLAMFVFTWALVTALVLLEGRSRWGRALSAVRTNPGMARAVGISVDRAYAVAFVVGSAIVAVGALYFAAKNTASPSMGVDPIIAGLIAMFLGGIGNTRGVALGGMVEGLSQNIVGLWVPGEYLTIVSFGLLIVVLLARPQGLLGVAAR